MSEKIMLIDGNSILNRAFYGLQGSQLLATSEGLYTNAVFGFLNILGKLLEEENPQYICVAFDMKAPTFRHKEFEGYKAKRKGMPQELAVQLPLIKEVLDDMNISRLEKEGFEADDIIGSVSMCAERKQMDVVIITGDRDSLQLASKTTRIKLPITRGGRTETDEFDYDAMLSKYGVTPLQFIDVKGLMGDSSDNIPGVPGVGEKTALELIKRFGSLDKLYENLDQVERKSVKDKLETNRELAFFSRHLATIDREMQELCEIEELKRKDIDKVKLYGLFKKLEFNSLIDKFNLKDSSTGNLSTNQITSSEVRKITGIEELRDIKSSIIAAGKLSIYYLLDKTDNFKTQLAGMSMSWENGNNAYIPIGGNITEDEFAGEFKEIFENPEIRIYGHDIKNLIVYLKSKGVELEGLAFDTMIAAYIVNPSRDSYTLAQLADEYAFTRIQPIEELTGKGKNARKFGDLSPDMVIPSTVSHAEVIMPVYDALAAVIRDRDQEKLYYDIELPLIKVLADMEHWGFKVDIDGLRQFSQELEGRITQLTSEIYTIAGEEFNINSTKQLGLILFEKLNLPVLKKTKTGYSTDAEVLDQLADRHEIVPKILEYRQLVKLRSTYVEGLIAVIDPAAGKIHSSFNQTVTVTGRISSTEPNLQNIPIKLELGRAIRKVFIPSSEDYILTDADYSQIELRVLAHITADENMISAFVNDEDIHTSTASQVFGIPKSEVTPLLRSRAKAVNFGIVYGIGDFSLSKDLGITRKEARKYIDGYLDNYPRVRQYMHDIVEQGRQAGYVTTLFNRRRYLPELKSTNFNMRSFGERIAMNTPIQGSAADIIKIAMVNVWNELKKKKLKSRLILQVHDELIIETHKQERDEVASILKDCMENAVKLRIPLSAEVKTGNTWYETK